MNTILTLARATAMQHLTGRDLAMALAVLDDGRAYSPATRKALRRVESLSGPRATHAERRIIAALRCTCNAVQSRAEEDGAAQCARNCAEMAGRSEEK